MSDNVLQDGTIVESRYAVERRDRTIHVRMREYLYTLKHMKNLETAILPHRVGGGPKRPERKGRLMRKTELLIPAEAWMY